MLSVNNLSFGYKRNPGVLKNISFALKPGVTLLIGENGSGKSTLIRVLVSSLNTNAEVLLNGKPFGMTERKKKMAYLPQEFNIYPSMKVIDILNFVAEAKGYREKEYAGEISSIAEQVNISQVLKKKLKECSVGTQRRVGIATSLIGDPEIIILDEPTAGIDPRERVRFYSMIQDCTAGKTVLIATHILDDMDVLADQVLMLSHGRIAYDGSYYSFRHSLDNSVYEASGDQMTEADMDYLHGAVLLGRKKHDGITKYRIAVMDNTRPPSCFVLKEPTLDDLWSYHQGDKRNGKRKMVN